MRSPDEMSPDLCLACSLIVTDPDILGGDPVLRGTRVPVRLIAAMLEQGSAESDILNAYPRITAVMVSLASVCTQAYPVRGRPRSRPWYGRPPVQRTRTTRIHAEWISAHIRQRPELDRSRLERVATLMNSGVTDCLVVRTPVTPLFEIEAPLPRIVGRAD